MAGVVRRPDPGAWILYCERRRITTAVIQQSYEPWGSKAREGSGWIWGPDLADIVRVIKVKKINYQMLMVNETNTIKETSVVEIW
jgi:hypothetical protein